MRKKALVASSYPAPYRVAVFQGLGKEYDLDVFFESCKNENRNADWFCKSGELEFHVLDNREAWKIFWEKLKHISQYDFVLAYDRTTKPGLLAINACILHKIPYFLNSDGWIYHNNLIKRAIKRIVYPPQNKFASGFFCSGKAAAKGAKLYGAKDERIFYHPFSSLHQEDILGAPVSENEKKQIRDKLGLKQKTTVLTIGQFIPRKGFDILIEAGKSIGEKAQLLIIGGGDEREKYEDIIRENNIKGIRLLGFMPKAELAEYYKASDIFVLPTREDIWGLVVNEAMAYGLPVITTDNCMAGVELIENGINGYIVKTGSSEELFDKISLLLRRPELLKEMSVTNLEKIQYWTIENIVKSHISNIDQIIK